MPAVSIIIPTFNRTPLLGPAIESALVQGPDVEVIVVDDGSTDDTERVLAGFEARIRLFRQSNQGPSAARNLGAGKAAGEYLHFLDSDDLLEPGSILAMLAAARQLDPAKVPFGLADVISEAGLPARGPTYGYPAAAAGQEIGFADLLRGVMPLCLLLVRRDQFLALGGLRTDLRLGEDHEFAVRLHGAGQRFVASNVPLVRVRQHGGLRLSGTANPEFSRRLLQLWLIVAALAEADPAFDLAAAQALSQVIWTAGRDAARCNDGKVASALFAVARELDPAAGQASPWPLRLAAQLAGPFRAERVAELVKAVLRRS